MDYQQKYLKYKAKYIELKQYGGLGGHLRVYFLTLEQYNELMSKKEYNFIELGVKINDKGFSSKYTNINQHHHSLYTPTTKKQVKLTDINTSQDLRFDYNNPSHINKINDLKTFAYILLVRNYTVLHDVYVGRYKILDDGVIQNVECLPK